MHQAQRFCERFVNDFLTSIDYVLPTVGKPDDRANLVVLEDNNAVVHQCNKGRSNKMRHVGRTHNISLDGTYDLLLKDPNIMIKHCPTEVEIADMEMPI